MKNFLVKLIIAIGYFGLMLFFVWLCGYFHTRCITTPHSTWNVILFILSILLMIGFIIIFISSWEDIFDPDDEQ
jgi:hypothetical protein